MDPRRKIIGIVKAKRLMKIWKQFEDDPNFDEDNFMRTHIKNRKKCSCSSCCNARRTKVGKKNQKFLTRQEKNADRELKDFKRGDDNVNDEI